MYVYLLLRKIFFLHLKNKNSRPQIAMKNKDSRLEIAICENENVRPQSAKKKYNIALITDMFYPNKGGIETHVKLIGEEFIKMGHNVIVITHKYNEYIGKIYFKKMLVYYLDFPVIICNTVLPSIFSSYYIFKHIFEIHKIDIVHGHQSMSTLSLEAIFHSFFLNIKTILTDHSLFEPGKIERVVCDCLGLYCCKNINKIICVSEASKLNTAHRLNIPLEKISVIPNGIIPTQFYPIKKQKSNKVKILFCARFVFRKGIDLFVKALPIICKDERVKVIIIGSGPKKYLIEQMIDESELHDQIELYKEINHEDIPKIMQNCDIFVNTSLTETFCMAILEASACGMIVVSTNVGGIKEVLEKDKILFCKPTPKGIAHSISKAITLLGKNDWEENHRKLTNKYNWKIIAEETVKLYDDISYKNLTSGMVYEKYKGLSNFLFRAGIWLEYLIIRFFNFWDNKAN